MNLTHYSDGPLDGIRSVEQPHDDFGEFKKPRGLWLSADDYDNNWRDWCIGEQWGLHKLTHVHTVRLNQHAPVLFINGVDDFDVFTEAYSRPIYRRTYHARAIDWPRVAVEYHGIIIVPYLWDRRLVTPEDSISWYYGWDCASGCIWNAAAIASVQLREIVPAPEPEQDEEAA
jgi:hypothetical protein